MISALLAFVLAPAPQQPIEQATLVTGVVANGRLLPAGLGLGDGGLGKPRIDPRKLGDGETLTPGGVLVRVREEGCKLDFPSGAELLVTGDARVHARSGEATLPSFHGLTLVLADGQRVVLAPAPGRDAPLDLVAVGDDDRALVLWKSRTRVVDAAYAAAPRGLVLYCLGDGGELWRPTVRGPLLQLERVLASPTTPAESAGHRLIVLGDVLRESLRLLPPRVPRQAIDFPDAHVMVRELSNGASVLFPRGEIPRPRGATGELCFALAADFRLVIGRLSQTPILVTLVRGDRAIPYVEWSIGPRTLLHITRPDGSHWQREVDVTGLLPK